MKQFSNKYRGFIVTPEGAIRFTKVTVYLTCIWSPLLNSKKVHFTFYKIFFYSSIFLAITLLFSLIVSIPINNNNTFVVIKSSILISGIINFLIKVIVITIYRDKIQNFDQHMRSFIKIANKFQRNCLQKYVSKCWKFQVFMTCSYYLTTAGVLIGPLFLPQKLPTDAVYPFPVENPIIVCLVYIHQCIVGFQCSAGMALDCQIALYLWYLGARYEMLALTSRDVISTKDLKVFVRNHQELYQSGKEIIYPIRMIVLTTVIMTRVGMIFGAIMLISDQALIIKIQFLILAMSATVNVFVCVWAADNLINVASRMLPEKIFESCCYQSSKMRKNWSFIIMRTHKPIVIKVSGFFNALSYEFYSSFLSTAFSYFTALRVLVNS